VGADVGEHGLAPRDVLTAGEGPQEDRQRDLADERVTCGHAGHDVVEAQVPDEVGVTVGWRGVAEGGLGDVMEEVGVHRASLRRRESRSSPWAVARDSAQVGPPAG